jgi:hypothetical protein
MGIKIHSTDIFEQERTSCPRAIYKQYMKFPFSMSVI